jgi:hypothetical protein
MSDVMKSLESSIPLISFHDYLKAHMLLSLDQR